MPKYGLISTTDANTLELTLRLIFEHFTNDVINVTEVGIYGGETGNGIREFIEGSGRKSFITGIDNNKDNEPLRFKYDSLIIGDADEMAFKIADNSQHLILLDACHCFAHTVSNFFSYADKVKKGAYIAFHDTGKHIQIFKDFQHGDKENQYAYISVRKALYAIGMFGLSQRWNEKEKQIDTYGGKFGFELIFDEADINNPAGGVCVFKKLY